MISPILLSVGSLRDGGPCAEASREVTKRAQVLPIRRGVGAVNAFTGREVAASG
jgi:hypothetical protein